MPTIPTEQDYDRLLEMSDEDFAKLGQQHQDQLRDNQGRFTKSPEGEPTVKEPAEPQTFRREIDLEDGEGVQVFEADTAEELIDKLAEAQANATKRIRELKELADEDEPKPRCATCGKKPRKCKCGQPAPLTDDEKFVLAQRMQQDPEAFFDAMFERKLRQKGSRVYELYEKANKGATAVEEQKVAKQFLAKRGLDGLSEADGQTIEEYFDAMKLPLSVKNLERAYDTLSARGLLVGNTSNEVDEPETAEEPPKAKRIAQPAVRTVVVQKKASSGLSVRKTPPKVAPELTVDDLYNMPMDKFLALGGMSKDGW